MAWTGSLLTVIALAAAAPPDQSPPPITRQQAQDLSAQEVAAIVLGQLAARVTSVTRPNYVSPFYPDLPLNQLEFAMIPESSYFAGLCQATVFTVSFFDGFPPAPRQPDQPVRARRVTTDLRYRVIGEVTLPYAASPDERARQDPLCAEQSTVLPPEERTLGHRQFFRFDGELAPQHGVVILQQLLRGVRDGTYTDHRCAGFDRCEDSGALLRSLSLDDLLGIGIEHDPANAGAYRLRASFLETGTTDALVTREVEVVAELEHPQPYGVKSLGPTTIRRVTTIRD